MHNPGEIIKNTETFIKNTHLGEGTGHDWWHIARVRQNALHIGRKENADLFITELAALLHDIADWKFTGGDEETGPREAEEWLQSQYVHKTTIQKVKHIIANISFKGAGVDTTMPTLEGKVVQDADRLDAMGAIGIARAFAYGGYKAREIYNPEIEPGFHASFEAYKNNNGPTINHFYEKLLHLKDLMQTPTGKAWAQERHAFMERYLETFFSEWQGAK